MHKAEGFNPMSVNLLELRPAQMLASAGNDSSEDEYEFEDDYD